MISLQRKGTEPIQWEKPLAEYISRVYQHDPAKYAAAIKQLEDLRKVLLDATPSIECRNSIFQYFWQFERLEQKIKIGGESGVKIAFKWGDSLTGDKATQASSAFEKANVLFCLAAVMTSIAAKQDLNSVDGLKLAVQHQRIAAGILTGIREKFGNSPFADLGGDYLQATAKVMLAQAHENTIKIARMSNKDQKIIGQLCAEASKLYGGITAFFENNSKIAAFVEGDNKGLICSKRNFYEAKAQLINALDCNQREAIGEELARLTIAVDCIRNINRRVLCRYSFYEKDVTEIDAEVAARFQKIKRLNEMVYYQKVPTEVPKCSTLEIVSPMGIESIFNEEFISKFTDIFGSLLPFSHQSTINAFEEEKKKIIETWTMNYKKICAEGNNIFKHYDPAKFQRIFKEDFTLPTRLRALKNDLKKVEKSEGTFDVNLNIMCRMISNLEEESHAIEIALQQEDSECTSFSNQSPSSSKQSSLSSKGAHFYSTLESLKSSIRQFQRAYDEIKQTWEKYQAFIFHMGQSEVLLSGQFTKDAAEVASESAKTNMNQLESYFSESKNIEVCFSNKLSCLKDTVAAHRIDHKLPGVDTSNETTLSDFIHSELETFDPIVEDLKMLTNKYKDLCAQFTAAYNNYAVIFNSDTSGIRDQAYSKYEVAFSEIKNLYPSVKTYIKSIESYLMVATNLRNQLNDFVCTRQSERQSIFTVAKPPQQMPSAAAKNFEYETTNSYNAAPSQFAAAPAGYGTAHQGFQQYSGDHFSASMPFNQAASTGYSNQPSNFNQSYTRQPDSTMPPVAYDQRNMFQGNSNSSNAIPNAQFTAETAFPMAHNQYGYNQPNDPNFISNSQNSNMHQQQQYLQTPAGAYPYANAQNNPSSYSLPKNGNPTAYGFQPNAQYKSNNPNTKPDGSQYY